MPNIETLALTLVAGLTMYLIYVTYNRARGNSDPSASLAADTKTGSATFTLSGTYLVLALVSLIAGITWPMPIENPILGVLLVGVLALHYVMERREMV